MIVMAILIFWVAFCFGFFVKMVIDKKSIGKFIDQLNEMKKYKEKCHEEEIKENQKRFEEAITRDIKSGRLNG